MAHGKALCRKFNVNADRILKGWKEFSWCETMTTLLGTVGGCA